jgi:hypothetical protein
MPPRKHFEFGPSSLFRKELCPGSHLAEKQCPDRPGKAAAEGTVAHELLEVCLTTNKTPSDFLGQEFAEGRWKFTVDTEMVEAVDLCLDFIESIAPVKHVATGRIIVGIEERLDMRHIHRGLGGTVDFWALDLHRKRLHVNDYKHGAGVFVEAEENPQNRAYGLGVAAPWIRPGLVKEVHLHITQPRHWASEKVRTEVLKINQLLDWQWRHLKPLLALCADPTAPKVPGEKQCQFCKACGTKFCPATANRVIQVAQADFDGECVTFPELSELTEEQLIRLYELAPAVSIFEKAIVQHVEGRVLAGELTHHALKVVEGNKSPRKWADPDRAEGLLIEYLGKENAFSEPKLLAPGKAEAALWKRFKAQKRSKSDAVKLINSYCEEREAPLVVVPSSDKREAVEVGPSFEDYPEV